MNVYSVADRPAARPTCRRARRGGFTLVEILVATAVTLLLVAALAQAFAVVSETVAVNRATIEMAGELRGVALRLQQDLEGLTLPVRPWPRGSSGLGYFEYFEGPETDYNANSPRPDTSIGDFDDILMFTAQNEEGEFVGQIQSEIVGGAPGTYTVIRSKLAEIIWWISLEDENANGVWDAGEYFTVHRRVLLIRPDLNNAAGVLPGVNAANRLQLQVFHGYNDLSVRPNGAGGVVANTLADLTNRANRFAHVAAPGRSFPYFIANLRPTVPPTVGWLERGYVQGAVPLPPPAHPFAGEDIVLAHALAFDVRVYDPTANVLSIDVTGTGSAVETVTPGDPGYNPTAAAPAVVRFIDRGAYVDLGYSILLGIPANSLFSGAPHVRSQLYIPNGANPIPLLTYDTWSRDYEYDGINQDIPLPPPLPQDPLPPTMVDTQIDEGTDGLDNDNAAGIDDPMERETSPPYPVPLRGIEVRLRAFDPDSRQVRQSTVNVSFAP